MFGSTSGECLGFCFIITVLIHHLGEHFIDSRPHLLNLRLHIVRRLLRRSLQVLYAHRWAVVGGDISVAPRTDAPASRETGECLPPGPS